MSKQRVTLSVLLVLALLVPGVILAQPAGPQAAAVPSATTGSTLFIENAGQWPDAARFQVWGSPAGVGTTWLADDAIWITIIDEPLPSPLHPSPLSFEERGEGPGERGEVHGLNLKLTFPGANPDVQIQPLNPLTTTVSYFLGSNPAQWHPAVPVYGGVRYADLYPGVDLVLGQADSFWQFEAEPGAAVDQVRVQVEGASVEAVADGVLRLAVDGVPLSLALPRASFTYRASGVSRQGEPATAENPPNSHLPQPVQPDDNSQDLVFGTYLGGSAQDFANAIAVDSAGHTIVTGLTYSTGFPTTPGAFDPSFNGCYNCSDVYVSSLNAEGSALVYSTFLGGSRLEEALAITLDTAGRPTLTGLTSSADFPVTPGAFDTSHNGSDDVFIARLSADGSSLLYSSFLGGGGSDYAFAIAMDDTGRTAVAGAAGSDTFPTTPGAYDTSFNGGYTDAFVAYLSADGTNLLYSTLLGGSTSDLAYGVTLDDSGRATVAGKTMSSNFPTTPGGFDPTFNDYFDGFITRLSADGGSLVYSTFLGGSYDDEIRALAMDDAGRITVTGSTRSSNFPITPGAFDTTYDEGGAFVARLNAAGSALAYSTFLGDGNGLAIAVDDAGQATVAGSTASTNFPTTPGAFDLSCACQCAFLDAFVARLSNEGNGLIYSTYLGGCDHRPGTRRRHRRRRPKHRRRLYSSHQFPYDPGCVRQDLQRGLV